MTAERDREGRRTLAGALLTNAGQARGPGPGHL